MDEIWLVPVDRPVLNFLASLLLVIAGAQKFALTHIRSTIRNQAVRSAGGIVGALHPDTTDCKAP